MTGASSAPGLSLSSSGVLPDKVTQLCGLLTPGGYLYLQYNRIIQLTIHGISETCRRIRVVQGLW